MSANCCQNKPEQLSYAELTEDAKIHQLGQLITAITCITEHQDSEEYAQLQADSANLENLQEFLHAILPSTINLDTSDSTALLQSIYKQQDQLKTICSSLYIDALNAILSGKDQEFSENPASFAEHPAVFYAQLLNDFVETKFFALSEQSGSIITNTFNYCCQKLYNECFKLEESITKRQIHNLVDCMWLFSLLEMHKNEIIYVLGGWRYANITVILEELRQSHADQSLENLDDKQMLKLMEALAAGASMDKCGCDDEEDNCCCGCE